MPHARRLLALPFLLLLVAGALSRRSQEPIRLGRGDHVYEWVRGWGTPPDGATIGSTHGCVVVDSRDRVYVNTDTQHAVVVLSAEGELLDRWGEDLAGGLHGMCLVGEGEEERLYLAHIGLHDVLEATLDGEVLGRLPWPEASGLYEAKEQYRPTSVAVGPDGRIYVADGYGASWIHRYDADGRYLDSFGGPGAEPGKLRTPHGLFLDERGDQPTLLVSDRENGRLQSFDLEGGALAVVEGMLRRPCHTHVVGDEVLVADLAGRVTILDGENGLVTHLGEGPDPAKRARNDIPREDWRDGELFSPHCASWDSEGNLYVVDWSAHGRISKLKRVR
jgi:hypothetical protein